MHTESLQINKKRPTPHREMAIYLIGYFTKEDKEVSKKHMKRCSILSVIKKLHNEIYIRLQRLKQKEFIGCWSHRGCLNTVGEYMNLGAITLRNYLNVHIRDDGEA